jgi:hypothetical protein
MRKLNWAVWIALACLIAATWVYSYPWPTSSTNDQTLEHRIVPPHGYAREAVSVDFSDELHTPEWTFTSTDLKRF